MAFSDRFTSILGKQKDPRSQPPQPLTRAEMDSMENELNDITGRLEAERKNREGIARFFKHPLRVLTEQPVNILIVCLPLSLIVFIGGFISMVKDVRHCSAF